MIDADTDIVCDAGPIIHLDEISCLDLLRDFRKIFLPFSVVDEIEKHRPLALTAKLPFCVLRGHNSADERFLAMCRIFALDISPNSYGKSSRSYFSYG